MYVPSHFKVEQPEVIFDFIRQNSFGLLLTTSEGEIYDTHTPFVLDQPNRLMGHIARANPHWQHWQHWQPGTKAKVVFQGPHTYISPSDYQSEFNVPTWNYTAASVSGKLSIIEDETDALDFLDTLTAQYETGDSPWKLDRDDERYLKLTQGIVVFSIEIENIEAAFKLNQNKSEADRQSVVNSLESQTCPFAQSIATLIDDSSD